MGLFTTLKKFVKGKADEADEAIQDKNRVLFAGQELKSMKEQLQNAQQNLGKMKAQLMGIERDINEKTVEEQSWTSKAKQLKEQEKVDLATQCAQKVLDIRSQLDALAAQKKMIQGHCDVQEANVAKLRNSIESAKRQFQSMKAMEQVAKSTDSLLDVNVTGVDNALSKFEEYTRKSQANLDEKAALLEAQTAGDLSSEVDTALNIKDQAAKDLLGSL